MLVFVGGLAPGYVLDEMEPYEMDIALEGLYLKNRDSWEQTRQIVYTQAQTCSAKELSPEKILPFPWDDKKESSELPTEKDINDLKEMVNQYIKEKNDACGFNNQTTA